MILKNSIITDLKINNVNDLYKLKPFLEDSTLKINKSQIARELEVDRRTVDKYINGYQKPTTRTSTDCISLHYDIIKELLSDENQQVFYYRKVLWQYLVDNHGFSGSYCNFTSYLKLYPEFDHYFRKRRPFNVQQTTVRYETDMGKQVTLQVYDGYVHVYYSTVFITIHTLSKNKLNYHRDHYVQIARQSHAFCDEKIAERAKENLAIIGRMYAYD